jgi:hypothetical protein
MADNAVISPTAFFDRTIPRTDYHRQYLFRVALDAMPGISDVSVITYFVANTSSPVETTGTINVDWMNSQVKLGGRTLYAEWTVTVRDDTDSKAYNYFKMWRRMVYQTSDNAGWPGGPGKGGGQSSLPSEYKKSISLFLLDNRGDETKRGYTLKGAFPTVIGAMTLDYSTEGIVTFPVTIQYDEFIPYPS